MDYQEYISKMKTIHIVLLDFLEKDDIEEYYQNLIKLLNSSNIIDDKHLLKPILCLILQVSKNHFHSPNLLNKIKQILRYLKSKIMKKFTNSEIFKICKNSKALLLFLIKEKMLIIDQAIYNKMTTIKYRKAKYCEFFLPEIKSFIENEKQEQKSANDKFNDDRISIDDISEELPSDFEEKREIGQNDNKICEIIRNDSIEEFIIFVKKNNFSLKSEIVPSIYETNSILITKNTMLTGNFFYEYDDDNLDNVSLIEYAAFFGSVQIFNYLYKNKVKLTSSLWIYAIHSDNSELISILEENGIRPKIYASIRESIKCHHNDITNYILNKYVNDVNKQDENIHEYAFHYFNFAFFPDDYQKNDSILLNASKYDYFIIVDSFIKTKSNQNINIDSLIDAASLKGNSEVINCLLTKQNEIRENLFYGCRKLTELSIPPTIKSIGMNAFYGCLSLVSIQIPNSVTSIGLNAFKKCLSLKQIQIPPKVTEISARTFSECPSLMSVAIPPSVTSIGVEAFFECSSLESIEIPSLVTSIEFGAFCECKSLKQIEIPCLLKSIEICSFKNCSSLEKVTLPPYLQSINIAAFDGCSSLKKIEIPETLKIIDVSAFSGCSSLEEIMIPSSVVLIGNSAFHECKSLVKVEFGNPSSLKSIGKFAFYGCSSLTKISIPTSVELIEQSVFIKCSSLREIKIPSSLKSDNLGINLEVNIIKI